MSLYNNIIFCLKNSQSCVAVIVNANTPQTEFMQYVWCSCMQYKPTIQAGLLAENGWDQFRQCISQKFSEAVL